jgi:hypothetical protein
MDSCDFGALILSIIAFFIGMIIDAALCSRSYGRTEARLRRKLSRLMNVRWMAFVAHHRIDPGRLYAFRARHSSERLQRYMYLHTYPGATERDFHP